MSSREIAYLEEIRLYARQAIDLAAGHTEETFVADPPTRLAVLHCLTVIGEAANQMGESAAKVLPDMPWSKIIGLRHVIVHHYRRVDLGEIWTIVNRDLLPLVERLESYLAENA